MRWMQRRQNNCLCTPSQTVVMRRLPKRLVDKTRDRHKTKDTALHRLTLCPLSPFFLLQFCMYVVVCLCRSGWSVVCLSPCFYIHKSINTCKVEYGISMLKAQAFDISRVNPQASSIPPVNPKSEKLDDTPTHYREPHFWWKLRCRHDGRKRTGWVGFFYCCAVFLTIRERREV